MSEAIREMSRTFSCPKCGGRPVWNPSDMRMKCPYCSAEFEVTMDRTPPTEYDIRTAPAAQAMNWGEEKHMVRCQACGAQTILGEGESATFCAFCGSPHVLEDQSSAGIAPESVIPFQVPGDRAVSSFRSWLKGKLFAPGKAKKMAVLGQITGVYLPHWTYDSDTVSMYTGQEGHYYYVEVPVTVTRNGKTVREMRRERRTRWVPTRGTVAQHFNDILIAGSRRLPEKLLNKVRPYDLSGLCRYRAEFLSGFSAEKAGVDVNEGWDSAQQLIDGTMRDLARRDILRRADEARVTGLDSQHSNVTYKLTLLPMYLSSFTYKSKVYHVLVNGQSGKCGGESPISAVRVAILVIALALIAAGIYYMMSRSGGTVPDVTYMIP
ncbi:MAG: hypothetical protein IKS31_10270 [Clostridia bacterium]|nr:hypothetical protein [Clostridia bacterium]